MGLWGAGGTFAIYSLLCRFARISPVGSVEAGDKSLRRYTSSQGRINTTSGRRASHNHNLHSLGAALAHARRW